MKVENPFMSRFAHGTLGHQLIFRRTPKAHAVYLHFKPKQPRTEAQVNHQSLFHLLADRWNHLTEAEKDYFQLPAEVAHMTRYNLYLRYNLQRLNPAQPAGLIGWWPNLIPAGPVLHDLTANRKDAEFVNLNPLTAWPHSARRRGYVISYDGTGYVNVPAPPSSTVTYTWAFWFKQNAYTDGSAIVDTDWTRHYVQCRFEFERATHRVRTCTALTPKMFLDDFTWHHYAGTYHPLRLRIYIDAVLHDTLIRPLPSDAQTAMRFGTHSLGVPPVHFRGQVDDLRFYDRNLDILQIAQLAAR